MTIFFTDLDQVAYSHHFYTVISFIQFFSLKCKRFVCLLGHSVPGGGTGEQGGEPAAAGPLPVPAGPRSGRLHQSRALSPPHGENANYSHA